MYFLTRHFPPPRFSFHHLVLSTCSLPSSCSLSIAPLNAVRNGESGSKMDYFWLNKFVIYYQNTCLQDDHLLGGMAIPYPFESSMPPI